MATCCRAFVGILLVSLVVMNSVHADPEALQDFCVADTKSTIFMNGGPCLNPMEASPEHFITSALRKPGNLSANPLGFSVIVTTPANMPGLNTLGLSMGRIDMAPGSAIPPHIHPRGSETIFVVRGALNVGFVDASSRLFSHKLVAGDVFVLPKGTVHYLQNTGKITAFIVSAFNSQNPGTVIVSMATFASTPAIPYEVLSKAFAISVQELSQIRKSLGGN
uniref:Germin-like protein n=1 Tax=Larix x marschlinsii TaxID=49226 RepID=Q4TUC1_9CONI|nr:germin-like protein [Larix x marschlinsii]